MVAVLVFFIVEGKGGPAQVMGRRELLLYQRLIGMRKL
jgi:hypothetical protein